MIPQAYINEWRTFAPWLSEPQIEQDLVLSRAIVEIFSEPLLANSLAFRGGTALHKLFIQPAARYSEDIDLVQINTGAIGPVFEALRGRLNPWLGEPKWKLKEGRATFIYRFDSESIPITPMRLKVEINTREHFTVLGLVKKIFAVENQWVSNKAELTTYTLEELLGTKLRALYQRKKGRDLFDIAMALKQFPSLEINKVIQCFDHYMDHAATKISRAEFEANLSEKLNDVSFIEDIAPLLRQDTALSYDPLAEVENVRKKVINFLSIREIREAYCGAV
ncbi:MAG: hypothetical protein A3C55_04510 [Gammaproteobacteria bacterium RIFCSPHIGHO2_02_FULL_42_13]|nr:MAG: hypothetical protein A3C55_04510 [Gammaproteobacteria bacterium RIFCSPHIGHO2_02_FULL_42_13]OGT69716.1 MAG: hypothetical protein A3H43_03365 [Gammaproteobacteria bacterium RIFCSPLOWO2_02_FULL_42_9]HLB58267.1 nucleotidyl transferase AbiEii/AbiGii toxin family protein [Gammaproteobacteria bacterium]